MFKYLLASVMVLALVSPTFSGVDPPLRMSSDAITFHLTIPCYWQVYWNDTEAQHIRFTDTAQDGSNDGDWWNSVLTGAYGVPDDGKASQDAWATDYYESYDAAFFWLQTNCNGNVTFVSGGDLNNGTQTLPTWYTMAFTNNMGCTPGPFPDGCGFIDGGLRDPCGAIPMDGSGCYGDDDNPTDNNIEFTNTAGAAFYPNQFSFPMDSGGTPTTYTGSFTAFAQGTILMHARVLRSGLADAGGTYTTTLTVNAP